MGLYPEQTSVYPADTLRLHLSFSPSVFRLDFYRHGAEFAFQFSVSGPSPGLAAVPAPPTDTTNPVTYADWNVARGRRADSRRRTTGSVVRESCRAQPGTVA